MLNAAETNETFRKYPAEFKDLMDFLVKENIRNVFFLSGDRHYSAMFRYDTAGRTFTELSASPLHAFPNHIEKQARGNSNPQLYPGSLFCQQSYGSIIIKDSSLILGIHNNDGKSVHKALFKAE
jgi:hypothetical protein